MPQKHTETTGHDELLDAVLGRYFERVEAGESPDPQSVIDQHPELADELRSFFADLERVDRASEPLRPASGAGSTDHAALAAGSTRPKPVLPRAGAAGESRAADASEALKQFGDYERLEEIWRGGMGAVYRAWQRGLNRPVAIKMILAGQFASDADVRRFHNEAEAVAKLDHPNIVSIYEVGEHEGVPFFSMKLMEGGSLAERIDAFRDDPRAAARLVVTVAGAVHHAHQRGILHRDLKPSNILLDEGRPFVADFGLAKRIAPGQDVTQTGAIVGTPSYMAPEQAAAGDGAGRPAVTTASDVYGLGAILYALLTGGPPFRGESVVETLDLVRTQPPRPPSQSNPRVDRDLETICLKCLEKARERRYSSPVELADDLNRWLDGEPINARPISRAARTWRWCRRNPLWTALAATLFVSVTSAIGLLAASNARIQTSLVQETQAKDRLAEALDALKAEQQKTRQSLERERGLSYVYTVALADRELANHYPGRADAYLDASPADLRGWEWHLLRRQSQGELFRIKAFDRGVCSVQFSPDGKLLMAAGMDCEIKLWDVAARRLVRTMHGHKGRLWRAVISPDGKQIASGASDGLVLVWDAVTGEIIHTLKGHDGGVRVVAFSPNGERIISAGTEGMIRIWDAATGQSLAEAAQFRGKILMSLAVSPDGGEIAVSGQGVPLTLLDPETGQTRKEFPTLGNCVNIEYSPDGTRIAVSDTGRIIHLVEPDRKTFTHISGHTNVPLGVVFQPDGKSLVSAGADRTIRFWQGGANTAVVPGHDGSVNCLTYSPGAEFLVTGGDDGVVKFWSPAAPVRSWTVSDKGSPTDFLEFSLDGRKLVQWHGADVGVWDWSRGKELRRFTPAPGREQNLSSAISPNLRRLAFLDADQTAQVLDFDSQQLVFSINGQTIVSFSPDGRFLGTRDRTGLIHVWDAETGAKVSSSDTTFGCFLFVPGSERIIAWGGQFYVWDFMTGTKAALAYEPDDIKPSSRVVLSRDARRIAILDASQSAVRRIDVRDTSDWSRLQVLEVEASPVWAMAFTPDGTRLAIGTDDRLIKVWDVRAGRPVLQLSGPSGRITSLTFSPNGQVLAVASTDRRVYTWLAAPSAD